MDKKEVEKEIERLWQALRNHCEAEIKKIEALCDEHGVVKYFTGLPPFDEYGNSGYYFPVRRDPESYGESWLPSDEIRELGGYDAEAGSWTSSSDRC